ncbi:hypothetical protein [Paracoccus albus]|uniref:hypothetical protein n=1 Tax=Paracoccus albus TaxID=3017784 RepID=UPI003EBB8D38
MPRSFGQSFEPMAFLPSLRGEARSNATHASTTDPDARLDRKSPGTERANMQRVRVTQP